ncbi:MAG: DUF6249 domain-containing protein [bacterium]
MEMLLGIISVVVVFGSIVTIFYLSYLGRSRRLETILRLVEKTGDINPELAKVLDKIEGSRSDFRKGLIWMAIGLPLTAGLAFDDGLEAAVFGLIPLLIGVAHLVVMRFGYNKQGLKES